MQHSSIRRSLWSFSRGSLLLLAFAASAQAADVAPFTKAPPLPAASWSGIYAGLGLGFRSTASDLTTTSVLFNGFPLDLSPLVHSQPFDGSGFRVNPYAGYNFQVAPSWVLGVEGDIGFGDHTTALAGFARSPWLNSTTSPLDSLSVKVGWDASLRGRAGYLLTPATLVYATGGVAWQHYDVTSVCASIGCNTIAPAIVSSATTKAGWTVGGGLETALGGHWLLRADYRYADFGNASFTITRTIPGVLSIDTLDAMLRTHTASVGLAYKFGEPVVGGRSHPLAAQGAMQPSLQSSWTGAYAGLGLGARAARTDLVETAESLGGIARDLTNRGTARPMDNTAFRVNPYAGYLWQFAPQWIAGVEGDVGIADRTTTREGYTTIGLSNFQSPGESLSIRSRWDASLRARLGLLVTGETMLYATGGVAWQNLEFTSTCASVPCSVFFGLSPAVVSASTTRTGWTVGGGLETRLGGNWLARADYRYSDYGTAAFTVARSSPVPPRNPSVDSWDVTSRAHLATFGLTYQFR